MQSELYPNILYLTNKKLAFLGTNIAEREDLCLLHPSNPLTTHYTNLASKLFPEIKIIKNMLWIGRVPSTEIIRIYFSEPYQYPSSDCCKQPVLIQVQQDKTGSVLCSECHKEVLRFVRAGKGPDSEMFKLTRRQMKARKEELRQMLTSLKFRGKQLKNNFFNQSNTNEDVIVQIIESSPAKEKPKELTNTSLSAEQLELKEIITDIFK